MPRFGRVREWDNQSLTDGTLCPMLAADNNGSGPMDLFAHRSGHRGAGIGRAVILVAAFAVSGCALIPDSAGCEVEHVSHPLAGWPVSARDTEDGLSQFNVYAKWQIGERGYLQRAVGWNLRGENGGGFYGPEWTYTARIGVELWSKDRSARR